MERLAYKVIKRTGTKNPYDIAAAHSVVVTEDKIGDAFNAYYAETSGVKIICINSALPKPKKEFAVAHCLYHALTRKQTIDIVVWMERNGWNASHNEALGNAFAVLLLSLPF